MKTKLPEKITTVEQAEKLLRELHVNNEGFHPEDNALNVKWQTCKPTYNECVLLNRLMDDISLLKKFDPCEFILFLATENQTQYAYNAPTLDPTIFIVIDGGIIQNILSNFPVGIIVIDYDIDGGDPNDFVPIPQTNDEKPTDAYVFSPMIEIDSKKVVDLKQSIDEFMEKKKSIHNSGDLSKDIAITLAYLYREVVDNPSFIADIDWIYDIAVNFAKAHEGIDWEKQEKDWETTLFEFYNKHK